MKGRETGKLGDTFFGACMTLEGKQAVSSRASSCRERKGTCVFSGAEKWKGEKEGFEISIKQ